MAGAHLPEQVRQWMGDPVGRWDGDTLVVETTNFTDKTDYRGTGENLRLVERFTRTAADVLTYRSPSTTPPPSRDPGRSNFRRGGAKARSTSTPATKPDGLEGILRGHAPRSRVTEETAAKKSPK